MAYSDPASKSDGDTLDLADWNTLRNNWLASATKAVNAKGDLLGGTGADALARLAVGANDSTLVAASGESTGLAWQIQPACRVYRGSNLDPATSSWVEMNFGEERFDTDSMHDTASNSDRIVVPANGGGIYLIGANVTFDTDGLGAGEHRAGLRIRLNGTTVIAKSELVLTRETGDNPNQSLHITTLYSLSATDYVTAQVYTEADVDVLATGNHTPEFWAVWQRRQ